MSLIYKQLKDARKFHRITQSHMAEILHVPLYQYASWERGLSDTPLHIIREFCSRFSVSADYLLGLSDQMIITKDARDLQYDSLSGLSDKSRKEALNFIEFLKSKEESIDNWLEA